MKKCQIDICGAVDHGMAYSCLSFINVSLMAHEILGEAPLFWLGFPELGGKTT